MILSPAVHICRRFFDRTGYLPFTKTLQQKVFHPFLIGMKKPRCIVHRGFHDDSLYQLFALSILCLVFALLFFAFFQNRFGIYRSRSKRTTVLREYLELFSGLKPDMKLGD